jgi:hypothetical protein
MPSPANVYQLRNSQLQVSYATGALGSKAGLFYQDASLTKQFGPQDLRVVSSEIGDLVTVTLQMTVDTGSTTFTLVVPKVEADVNQSVQIETLGITTIQRLSPIPIFNRGQREVYSVADLRGTAAAIPF